MDAAGAAGRARVMSDDVKLVCSLHATRGREPKKQEGPKKENASQPSTKRVAAAPAAGKKPGSK